MCHFLLSARDQCEEVPSMGAVAIIVNTKVQIYNWDLCKYLSCAGAARGVPLSARSLPQRQDLSSPKNSDDFVKFCCKIAGFVRHLHPLIQKFSIQYVNVCLLQRGVNILLLSIRTTSSENFVLFLKETQIIYIYILKAVKFSEKKLRAEFNVKVNCTLGTLFSPRQGLKER